MALAVGDNAITVAGAIAGTGASTATNAIDSAANYAGGWTNGSNGGTGFGAWTLSADANAGHFTGANGFGFWSHEGGNLAQAFRTFAAPLATGQVFSVHLQNGWIWESGGSVGAALRNGSGDTIWQLYFNGGDTNYNTPAGVTDIGWTDAGIDVVFTLTDTNAYSVEVHPWAARPASTTARSRVRSSISGPGPTTTARSMDRIRTATTSSTTCR